MVRDRWTTPPSPVGPGDAAAVPGRQTATNSSRPWMRLLVINALNNPQPVAATAADFSAETQLIGAALDIEPRFERPLVEAAGGGTGV